MPVLLLKKIGLIFSLNDPGWGNNSDKNSSDKNNGNKKPVNGPPDIDQLWQDFNQRLQRFLGGKKGGGNGNNGNSRDTGLPSGFKSGRAGIALILAVIFLWLGSGFFIVQEGQTAVILTLGKYTSLTGAGVNWRWPAPFQDHEIVDVSRVRTIEVGYRSTVQNKQSKEALMLTEDENIIDIQFAVQYKLKSAADWIFNNRDQEDTVRQIAETSIREIVGKSKMDFVLYEGREKVAFEVALLMQKIADRYKAGIQIINVTMQGVQPPEQVQAAFDDAVKAGQDRERQKNEGQAYANDVIPKARGAAARLLQESAAYRASVIANAEGEAARFKQIAAAYEKAPALTKERIYLETMQKIFSSTTKVLIDNKNNNLLYLPLEKLMAQAGVNVQDNSYGKAPSVNQLPVNQLPVEENNALSQRYMLASPPAIEEKTSRSRESRDSRNREGR